MQISYFGDFQRHTGQVFQRYLGFQHTENDIVKSTSMRTMCGCHWRQWNAEPHLLRFFSICRLIAFENLFSPSYPSWFWKWKTDVCENVASTVLWSQPVSESQAKLFVVSNFLVIAISRSFNRIFTIYQVHMQEQEFFSIFIYNIKLRHIFTCSVILLQHHA